MHTTVADRMLRVLMLLASSAIVAACSDAGTTAPARREPLSAGVTRTQSQHDPAAPANLVTLSLDDVPLTVWPYTGNDFDGAPSDPINAIFTGYAEPLRIRAALRRLDGNRTAFGLPAAAPFNCTWKDAIGDEQTAYGEPEQWTGSAVQLACGEYSPMRFHVRLFAQGASTLANAHMDLHITGTNEHEVISWELAEQILAIDMLRTGLLAGAPQLTEPITQAPTFREVRGPVYAGLPAQLKALVGLATPAIPNDGRARLFDVAIREPVVADVVEQEFTIQFNQIIPKPFCGGPADYLLVQGPLVFRGVARVTESGIYQREHSTTGQLTVLAVNPLTGQAIGPSLQAQVSDEHLASVTPAGVLAHSHRLQQLFDAEGVLQASQDDKLRAGTRGDDDFTRVVYCVP